MATGPTVPPVAPNDWQTVQPNDWQTIPPAHQEALGLIDQLRNYADTTFAPNTNGSHPIENALRGAAHGISNMVLHPVNSILNSGGSSGNYPEAVYTGYQPADKANANNPSTTPLVQNAQANIDAAKRNPAYTAGSILGSLAATAGAAKGIEIAPEIGNAVHETAIAPVFDSAKNVASKLVPSLVDGPPESLMTRAIKPGKNNVNWNADIKAALPLAKSAEQDLGHLVTGTDDALDATQIAKQDVWQQYKSRLGPAAQMGATIDGNQIANAMMDTIGPRAQQLNPNIVERVTQQANTYRRPLTVDEAEEFLSGKQGVNNELNSYYAKNKVGRRAAEADPEMAATVAEGDALRDALYNKLDQVSGPGAAQLKQAYGSLTNLEKELRGRQLVAARQNPESLSEQLSTVRGAGKIVKGVVTLDPGDVLEGAQNIAVSRALKARNSSDAMIARAFAKAQPASPFPMPASPRFAGLLPRGAIPMEAPGNVSSAPSMPPHNPLYYGPEISRGRLLPAQTGGPIELPYVPEMSGGDRLAALMQYLRSHPQAALPAKSSAIPLPPPR